VSAAASGPAIEVLGLVKRYAGRTVLADVSFSVERGTVFALLGPNGAGKTTTVETIEGYRSPDGGSVRVLGLDPIRDGQALRGRLGLMLQGGGIYPLARSLELLRLFARFYVRPLDAADLLERVGLTDVAGTRYRSLSGGERQRLGLALALIGRPELVVLDEPTAGMDPAAKATTRQLIANLRADGVSVLLTTHDMDDVERLADRVALIDRGRLVALGTLSELTAGAKARVRFRLAVSLSEPELVALGQRLGAIDSAARVASDGPQRYRVDGAAAGPELIAALADWCAERDIQVVELDAGGGSLEERYLELVGDDGEVR
jgi:ABC-2 type transport system ATP-binding protein